MSRAQEIADLLSGVTITTDDNNAQLTLKSTDADANEGPTLILQRDSSSPADNDALGRIDFTADNDAGASHGFVTVETKALDVSDGAETGQFRIYTHVAGTARSRFDANATETVFNNDSVDLDFRVEGNGNANAFFVQGSDDFIGIGTGTPKKKIHIQDTTSDGILIFDANDTVTDHQICFAHNYQSGGQTGGNYYAIGVDGSENKLVFAFDANSQASLSADAKMVLDSSGNVGISTTAPVANLEIEDGGTSNSILTKITADDQNPYALMIGNDTYSATDTNAFGFVQRNDGAAYIYNGGALRAAFHSVNSGVLSLEGGVVLGAGAANSTTANTLSDYEEGTFSAVLDNVSVGYGSRSGRYTKIGNTVFVHLEIATTSLDTTDGSAYQIGGLPFTADGGGVLFTYDSENSTSLTQKSTRLGARMNNGLSSVRLSRDGSDYAYNNGTQSAGSIVCTLQYFTSQ